MTNVFVSIIRTVIPVIVGSVLTWLAAKGIDVDPEQVNAWLIPIGISVYYTVVRFLEDKFPALGWLLGLPKQPGYSPADAPPARPAPGRNENL